MTAQTLTAATRVYLYELAADIDKNGGLSGDLVADLAFAHGRRQLFGREMMEGKSDRAKMARHILMARLYSAASSLGAANDALRRAEHIAGPELRQFVKFHASAYVANTALAIRNEA